MSERFSSGAWGNFLIAPEQFAQLAVIFAGIILSFGAGILSGYAARGMVARMANRFPGMPVSSTSAVPAIAGNAVAALLLLILLNFTSNTGLSRWSAAAAFGVACGLLTFGIGRLIGLRSLWSRLAALAAAVTAIAAAIGDPRPVVASLDSIGFAVGHHKFTLLQLIGAAIAIVSLWLIARLVNRLAAHWIGASQSLDASQKVLTQKLVGIGVVMVGVLLGIDLLGIDLTALTVFSGAFGLAVGFGLQKTLGNLIAGLILLMDRSIKPGDVIVVGDTFGAVNKIGVRAVSVVTRDGKEHLIPNEKLMIDSVENWSHSSRNVRVHIPVGISYSSDLALAQKLMIDAATASDRVLEDPKPSVWLKAFGDNAVEHDILVWIDDPELGVGNIQSEILNRIWKSFVENGIEIPFPQRDVHIKSMSIAQALSVHDETGEAGKSQPNRCRSRLIRSPASKAVNETEA